MDSPGTDWQLLILAFQGGQDSTRVRLWRALKALGAATLRDGVYLLPNRSDLRDALLELAESARAAGNQAYHLPVAASAEEQVHYRSLFDREAEYRTLQTSAETLLGQLPGLGEAELLKRLRQIHREAEQLRRTDYFPGPGRGPLEALLSRLESAAQSTLSPDEPSPAPDSGIPRLDPADYRGRLWATRAAMWVDRVASAWLIREFIDPEARFVWLPTPADCPAEALGFDFNGAAFTHVGDRVPLRGPAGRLRPGARQRSRGTGRDGAFPGCRRPPHPRGGGLREHPDRGQATVRRRRRPAGPRDPGATRPSPGL